MVAVVEGLARRGEADGDRAAHPGSAAQADGRYWSRSPDTDVFAGGTSLYGVADLIGLAEDTHDFEARYIDGLVGPLPEARPLYVERSPLSTLPTSAARSCLLQGLEDKIVPPRQAEMFRDALAAKGIAHAYVAFEGEQHGFRRPRMSSRALEAELSFYGQVLGFEPVDVPKLPLVGGERLKLRRSGTHDLATVDVEDVPGDPAGVVGQQKQAHPHQIVGLTLSLQGERADRGRA